MIADHFPDHLDPQDEDLAAYAHELSMAEAQQLADSYCVEKLTMAEAAEEAGISLESFKHFRRAHGLRKGKAVIVDQTKTIEEGIDHFTEESKRREIDRKARKKERRERDKAARQWWRLEDSLDEAAEAFREENYNPPRLRVRMSQEVEERAAGVLNLQDLHLGARPADAEDFDVEEYRDSILRRVQTALEDAARLRKLEQIYVVGGGDLVHSDTKGGQTASGTELDMACSTSRALQHAIHLLVEVVDMARQVGLEVTIVPVFGNHDRTNGVAAAMAAGQRFHSAESVASMGLAERQYATYGRHLLCLTHGDYSKKTMRRMGEIMRSESREAYGSTQWTSLFVGHLHHKAMDMVDESGRVIYQTPSPVPLDGYHDQEGYVGSRKAIQLVLLERDSGGDRLLHA
ncbi:hypothetical protein [Salinibacter grassmerensis]|uniref:hypothetical protein n=1 Tax=Salinibacter grassmerensis TaxID=3040353 RepID=UPI0021E799A4|nr:hypothetical protein [Salinibacter grassmerensis]